MAISASLLRTIQLGNRVLQWISTIIVLGIISYFIDKGFTYSHTIYEEVIAALSAVVFLPGLALGFVNRPILGQGVVGIDVVFSYLWLTAFVFTAQDWSMTGSNLEKTAEAFTFLTFFTTLIAILLDIGLVFPKAGVTGTTVASDKHANGSTAAATA